MLETRARESYVELVLDARVPVGDEEPRDSSAIPAGLPLGRVRAYSDADGGDQFAVRIARGELVAVMTDLAQMLTPGDAQRVLAAVKQ